MARPPGRVRHAKQHCTLWNEGEEDAWVASWRTIADGPLTMFDPVGTEAKSGPNAADYMAHTWDLFQEHLRMDLYTVHVNGDEMAWVFRCQFMEMEPMHSIETFRWEADGSLLRTYYTMPESVGADDDPYVHLLGDSHLDG